MKTTGEHRHNLGTLAKASLIGLSSLSFNPINAASSSSTLSEERLPALKAEHSAAGDPDPLPTMRREYENALERYAQTTVALDQAKSELKAFGVRTEAKRGELTQRLTELLGRKSGYVQTYLELTQSYNSLATERNAVLNDMREGRHPHSRQIARINAEFEEEKERALELATELDTKADGSRERFNEYLRSSQQEVKRRFDEVEEIREKANEKIELSNKKVDEYNRIKNSKPSAARRLTQEINRLREQAGELLKEYNKESKLFQEFTAREQQKARQLREVANQAQGEREEGTQRLGRQADESSARVTRQINDLNNQMKNELDDYDEELSELKSRLNEEFGLNPRAWLDVLSHHKDSHISSAQAADRLAQYGLQYSVIQQSYNDFVEMAAIEVQMEMYLDTFYKLFEAETSASQAVEAAADRFHSIRIRLAQIREKEPNQRELEGQEQKEPSLTTSLNLLSKSALTAAALGAPKDLVALHTALETVVTASKAGEKLARLIEQQAGQEEREQIALNNKTGWMQFVNTLIDAEKQVERTRKTIDAIEIGTVDSKQPEFQFSAEDLASRNEKAKQALLAQRRALTSNVESMVLREKALEETIRRAHAARDTLHSLRDALITLSENGGGILGSTLPLMVFDADELAIKCNGVATSANQKIREIKRYLPEELRHLQNLKANYELIFGVTEE